jgi:hypothetical protein
MTTFTQQAQRQNVRKLVQGWIAKDQKGFMALLNGEETISAGRFARIAEAYAEGTEDQLPPIRYAPQFGEVEDGRHRLMMAWIMGRESITADLVWVA